MKGNNLFSIGVLAVLVFSPIAFGLSSDAVLKTVAAKYLDAGEEATTLLSTPVDLEGERYWLAEFHLATNPETSNLFLAVSDTFGAAENNAERLERLFALAGKLEVLNALKKNKLSIDDLEIFLADSEGRRDTAERNFVSLVKQQLELRYQTLDFSPVETNLEEFKQKQEKTREEVRTMQSLREKFEAFPSTVDFGEYFLQYNLTLNSFDEVTKAAEKYQNGLLVFTESIANSAELNFSDKQLIKSVLERLSDIGDYRGFKNSQLIPAQKSFNSLSASSERIVGDRVDSTLDRIAKKDAQAAVTPELEARVNKLLNPQEEFRISSCNIDLNDLKSEWLFVRSTLKVNATRDNLLLVPAKASQVEAMAGSIELRYSECLTSPRQPPVTTRQDSSSAVNLLIIILVVLIAYAGYKKYREIREQSA